MQLERFYKCQTPIRIRNYRDRPEENLELLGVYIAPRILFPVYIFLDVKDNPACFQERYKIFNAQGDFLKTESSLLEALRVIDKHTNSTYWKEEPNTLYARWRAFSWKKFRPHFSEETQLLVDTILVLHNL